MSRLSKSRGMRVTSGEPRAAWTRFDPRRLAKDLPVLLLVAGMVVVATLTGCTSEQDKAKRIAEDLGMPLWLPASLEIGAPGSYEPVEEVTEPAAGMRLTYEDFEVFSWPSPQVQEADALDAYVLLEEPPADSGIELVMEEVRDLKVGGSPARGVTWHEVLDGGKKVTPPASILVFQLDGAVLRLIAGIEGPGLDDLADVAESFERVE